MGIADVIEIASDFLVDDLKVGEGGRASGAPVNDALAAVYKALAVEVDESGAYGAAGAFVEGEALSGPVAGSAEPLVLLGDGAAVLAYPFPYPRNERLSADFLPGLSLFGELPFDDDLSCDACVVAAREPEGWVAHHAMPADERVLGGGGQCVAEVEFTRNVGRRHDDDKRLLPLFY